MRGAWLLLWLTLLPVARSAAQRVQTDAVADETITVKGVSFVMKGVAGGTFTMGATAGQGPEADSDECPVHEVTLSGFRLGQTVVTQRL